MEFVRATRDDHPAIESLLRAQNWWPDNIEEGQGHVARENGDVVGHARIVEVAPQVFYVASALVREDHRGAGIGSGLMRHALPDGGTTYLACHDERVAFYERLGFVLIEEKELPRPVLDLAVRQGDLPNRPDHAPHRLMRR